MLGGVTKPHAYRTAVQNPLYVHVHVLWVVCFMLRGVHQAYILVRCRASGRVRTSVQDRLPALAISADSRRTVRTVHQFSPAGSRAYLAVCKQSWNVPL